jgi:hypothetical protein
MKILFRIFLLAALAAVGWLAWTLLYPDPKTVIQHRLTKLAEIASFPPDEGNIRRVANIEKMGSFFTEDAQVMLDIPGVEVHTISGRQELMQMALAAKGLDGGLKAELLDPDIQINSGNQSALVDVTLKARAGRDTDLIVQELKFTLKQTNGDWLITRVETVQTLKR